MKAEPTARRSTPILTQREGTGQPPPGLDGPGAGEHQRPGGRSAMEGEGPPGDPYLFGWGVRRRYGLSAFQPLGNFPLASSSVTAGMMITSSPCFQFTGVATLYCSVSWRESITRRISSKFRPVVCG